MKLKEMFTTRGASKRISYDIIFVLVIWLHINQMKHSEAIRSNEFLLLRFLLRRPKLQIIQFFWWVESKMETTNHKKVDHCLTVKDNECRTQISLLILRILCISIERNGNIGMVQKGCFRSFEIMKQSSRYDVWNFKYLIFIIFRNWDHSHNAEVQSIIQQQLKT